MEVIERLYLIDIITVILCLRISYIAVFRGFLNEAFKVLGLFCGVLLSFHYYPVFAEKLGGLTPFLNAKYTNFIFFLIIFLSIMGVFSLVRRIFAAFIKKEDFSVGERWFALLLGGVRFVILTSMIFFCLNLYSKNPAYLNDSVSYRVLRRAAPKIYLVSLGIFNNFYPKAELNKEVEEYYETRSLISGNSKERH